MAKIVMPQLAEGETLFGWLDEPAGLQWLHADRPIYGSDGQCGCTGSCNCGLPVGCCHLPRTGDAKCYGCGAMPVANIGVPVCVACLYSSGCKLFHFDDTGRCHCDDPPDWHDLEVIKKRLQAKP